MPPQDQKVMLPSSQGGLVRYFDEYKSKIQIKPAHVIILSIAVIIIILLMHSFGEPVPAGVATGF
jgi:preprotein translocase subunit Sec61beta